MMPFFSAEKREFLHGKNKMEDEKDQPPMYEPSTGRRAKKNEAKRKAKEEVKSILTFLESHKFSDDELKTAECHIDDIKAVAKYIGHLARGNVSIQGIYVIANARVIDALDSLSVAGLLHVWGIYVHSNSICVNFSMDIEGERILYLRANPARKFKHSRIHDTPIIQKMYSCRCGCGKDY